MFLRWQGMGHPLPEAHRPRSQVVRFEALADLLPTVPHIAPAARKAQLAQRVASAARTPRVR